MPCEEAGEMAEYQFGVIGGGNMAEALLRGVIAGNFLPHSAIVASDPLLERRQLLMRELSVACVDDNAAAGRCTRVLLAVKPQVMEQRTGGGTGIHFVTKHIESVDGMFAHLVQFPGGQRSES